MSKEWNSEVKTACEVVIQQGLCWKCREWLEWSIARGLRHPAVKEDPSSHCHHEPREKEKCWCERGTTRFVRLERYCDGGWESSAAFRSKFCPGCGRKL
jgi:hypothetical protein